MRRRRVLLGTVATGLLVALALPWSGTGGSLATPGPALAGEAVVAHNDLRRPAGRHAVVHRRHGSTPRGDPRPVVAKLEAAGRGDTVVPGEQLVLP